MKYAFLILTILCASHKLLAQDTTKFVHQSTDYCVFDFLHEGDTMWMTSYNGLHYYNRRTGERKVFSPTNTPIMRNVGSPTTLVRTDDGSKWLSTEGGIAKFDGRNWRVWSTVDSTNVSLANAELYSDGKNIWTRITLGETINPYLPTWAKFDGQRWELLDQKRRPDLPNEMFAIYSYAADKLNNSYFLNGQTIVKYSPTTKVADRLYVINPQVQTAHTIKECVFDNNNNLWGVYRASVGRDLTKFGIAKYDGNQWTFINNHPYKDSTAIEVGQLKIDKQNRLWLPTTRGLLRYDNGNWRLFDSTNNIFLKRNFRTYSIDSLYHLWVTYFSWAGGGETVREFDENLNPLSSFSLAAPNQPHPGTWVLKMDKFGNKWQYTGNSDLTKYDGQKWTQFTVGDRINVPYFNVNDLEVDANGKDIWLSSQQSWNNDMSTTLVKYDGQTWTKFNYNKTIDKMVADPKRGGLWFAYNDTLTYLYQGVFKTYNLKLNRFYEVRDMAVDSSGYVWLSSVGGARIARFNPTDSIVTQFYHPQGGDYFDAFFMVDKQGDVWLSTYNDYLYRWNGTTWRYYDSTQTPVPRGQFGRMKQDKQGRFWITTFKGLYLWDGGINWTNWNIKNSAISSNYLTDIVIDSLGNKWLGTWHSGINIFNENGVRGVPINTATKDFVSQTDKYTLSPNPFSTESFLRFDNPDLKEYTLTVFDISGRKVSQQTVRSAEIELKRTTEISGLYFFTLEGNGRRTIGKFVVQ